MVDAVARLLSIPLRHVYAVLLRAGLIEVGPKEGEHFPPTRHTTAMR